MDCYSTCGPTAMDRSSVAYVFPGPTTAVRISPRPYVAVLNTDLTVVVPYYKPNVTSTSLFTKSRVVRLYKIKLYWLIHK